MPRDNATAISPSEAKALFADLQSAKALVLAVSGGPDSTALMLLAARWRKALRNGPELIAVTVDHGLRVEAKREAHDVAKLAKALGLTHRTLRWTGVKPKAGIPQAARNARYALLAKAARKAGALHVLTAHTLDDQAETVVMRLARGSGVSGLAAMQRVTPLAGHDAIALVRPLLDLPKVRLIATLNAAKIAFADDPTNRDTAFTRARLRGLMPQLAAEGLDASRLALLARRMARADDAIESMVDAAMEAEVWMLESGPDRVSFELGSCYFLPQEIVLRAFGRAIDRVGDEGPVELGKLERLLDALKSSRSSGKTPYRRTLAGAVVTLDEIGNRITVETAPPRRQGRGGQGGNALTKPRPPRAGARKTR